MGLIAFAWVLVIVLKVAGLAFIATSWAWIILWPLIPALILFILFMFGIAGMAFWQSR